MKKFLFIYLIVFLLIISVELDKTKIILTSFINETNTTEKISLKYQDLANNPVIGSMDDSTTNWEYFLKRLSTAVEHLIN